MDARLLLPALLAWIVVAAMLSLRPMILTLSAAGFAVIRSVRGVRTNPGDTQLTRTPRAA